MDDPTLWNLMRDTWMKIEEKFDPVINQFVESSKLSMREWMLLLAALTFEPEDTTPSHLMVRGPYTSSERYLEGLENAANLAYLERVGEGRYRLTSYGKDEVYEFIRVARDAMIDNSRAPAGNLSVLATRLERLISGCLETPPPPDTWSIMLSYKLMPSLEPPLPFIEQAISCLSAYRDDAHLASWCSSGLSASAMEILTLAWRGQVETLNEITQKLSFRGHPDEVYLAGILELKDNGYLTGTRNHLQITDEGNRYREQVEEITDQYFFHPWDCLSVDEKAEMAEILGMI